MHFEPDRAALSVHCLPSYTLLIIRCSASFFINPTRTQARLLVEVYQACLLVVLQACLLMLQARSLGLMQACFLFAIQTSFRLWARSLMLQAAPFILMLLGLNSSSPEGSGLLVWALSTWLFTRPPLATLLPASIEKKAIIYFLFLVSLARLYRFCVEGDLGMRELGARGIKANIDSITSTPSVPKQTRRHRH